MEFHREYRRAAPHLRRRLGLHSLSRHEAEVILAGIAGGPVAAHRIEQMLARFRAEALAPAGMPVAAGFAWETVSEQIVAVLQFMAAEGRLLPLAS
jgi:hypothetical protein